MTHAPVPRRAVGQPAGPASRRSLRDWTERQRTTAVEALRYTRFVSWMKRLLPLAAAGLLAAVVAYSLMPRPQEKFSVTMQQSGNVSNDLTMTRPRFTGTDGKGNPFSVTAAEAVQDPENRHRAELHQVEAEMQVDAGNRMRASAATGAIDTDAGTLKLTGGLSLFTDSGYELHAPSADVYFRTNIVEGAGGVTGRGPLGSLSADRFHVDRMKRQVKLSGHVHMLMYPKKANGR